jgi:hypothetical protein
VHLKVFEIEPRAKTPKRPAFPAFLAKLCRWMEECPALQVGQVTEAGTGAGLAIRFSLESRWITHGMRRRPVRSWNAAGGSQRSTAHDVRVTAPAVQPKVLRVPRIAATVCLLALTFSVTACGAGSDTASPLGDTPKCSDIWVEGNTVPENYEGCENGDTIEAVFEYDCPACQGELSPVVHSKSA